MSCFWRSGIFRACVFCTCAYLCIPVHPLLLRGNLLLDILQACILHEEAPCAAFGAGVGSACVVDIGAECASVTCVDEGMAMPVSKRRYTESLFLPRRSRTRIPMFSKTDPKTMQMPHRAHLFSFWHAVAQLHANHFPTTHLPAPPPSPPERPANTSLSPYRAATPASPTRVMTSTPSHTSCSTAPSSLTIFPRC